MYKGVITHQGIAEERGLSYKELDLLLAAY
jgi:hypothetical protein